MFVCASIKLLFFGGGAVRNRKPKYIGCCGVLEIKQGLWVRCTGMLWGVEWEWVIEMNLYVKFICEYKYFEYQEPKHTYTTVFIIQIRKGAIENP